MAWRIKMKIGRGEGNLLEKGFSSLTPPLSFPRLSTLSNPCCRLSLPAKEGPQTFPLRGVFIKYKTFEYFFNFISYEFLKKIILLTPRLLKGMLRNPQLFRRGAFSGVVSMHVERLFKSFLLMSAHAVQRKNWLSIAQSPSQNHPKGSGCLESLAELYLFQPGTRGWHRPAQRVYAGQNIHDRAGAG